MKITLSNTLLDMVSTEGITNVPPFNQPYFNQPSGTEPYRLLVHIAYSFNHIKIADVGTNRGASALALSQNINNKVFSLDIADVKENDMGRPNIEFCLGDFHTDENIQKRILGSDLIYLDIDHEYTHEIWFYKFLVQNKWNGLLLCDDTDLCETMRRFWNEVDAPKVDLTKYGHVTGTGCIYMGESNVEFDLR